MRKDIIPGWIVILIALACTCFVAAQTTQPTESSRMNFVRIAPGTFTMGSPATEPGRFDNETAHEVRLTRGFEIATTPVTRGQFAAFIADTNYKTSAEREGWSCGAWNAKTNAWDKLVNANWRNPGFEQTDEHPVVDVDFNDAFAYCQWLSKRDARTYRLPTEAEWEYASRAGASTAWFWGDDPADGAGRLNALDESARQTFTLFPPFPWNDGFIHTSPVTQFRANDWGVRDALGNVLQWCSDWFADYPTAATTIDPQGPPTGTQRCLRGGAFVYGPKHTRNAFRGRNDPTFRNFYIGFRVVREE